MSAELLYALDELEKDKGIDREVIIAAIEEALNASYGKATQGLNLTGRRGTSRFTPKKRS